MEEEYEDAVEARDPLFKLELLEVMPNENRLPVDEVEIEGTFSGALMEPSAFKLLLSSVLSDPGSLVTNSVATGIKLHNTQSEKS